jgi:hypothetical protein
MSLMAVMKIKKAIPVKNIHLTNRGKRAPLFIMKSYFRKYQRWGFKAAIGKFKYLTSVFVQ